jgi:hypothetical protein
MGKKATCTRFFGVKQAVVSLFYKKIPRDPTKIVTIRYFFACLSFLLVLLWLFLLLLSTMENITFVSCRELQAEPDFVSKYPELVRDDDQHGTGRSAGNPKTTKKNSSPAIGYTPKQKGKNARLEAWKSWGMQCPSTLIAALYAAEVWDEEPDEPSDETMAKAIGDLLEHEAMQGIDLPGDLGENPKDQGRALLSLLKVAKKTALMHTSTDSSVNDVRGLFSRLQQRGTGESGGDEQQQQLQGPRGGHEDQSQSPQQQHQLQAPHESEPQGLLQGLQQNHQLQREGQTQAPALQSVVTSLILASTVNMIR